MTDALPSTCTLFQGDCLKVMPTLAPASVAMVFADLPYGVTRRAWDICIDLFVFWDCIFSICKTSAPSILTASQPFAAILINSNIKNYRSEIIWDKGRVTGFLNAKRSPLRRHEGIYIFSKKPHIYKPIMVPGKPWSKKVARNADLNYGPVKENSAPQSSDGMRYPTSILSVASGNKGSLHPTQKPVSLLEWLIKTYTNEGDTVLDPVFGSCTTGVACARLGRNFIGIEKDAEYFKIGTDRVNKERASLGLNEAKIISAVAS